MSCGRQDVSAIEIAAAISAGTVALCGRCRREFRPTPLDIVLDALSMTPASFADATGIPVRTVIRATKGVRMGRNVAHKLAAITGFHVKKFRWDIP